MEDIKRKLVRAFNKRLLPCTTGAGACGIMQEALRPRRARPWWPGSAR